MIYLQPQFFSLRGFRVSPEGAHYLLLHTAALTAGVILDLFIGDPPELPHPVRAIGYLISKAESILYRKGRRSSMIAAGALMAVLITGTVAVVSSIILILSYLIHPFFGAASEAFMTFYILSARSLRDESMKVYKRLETGDLLDARKALSMIVGRDTENLDEAGVIRAAVETVAENTSDGVTAPLIYTALFGPVGGFIYKAVNTMDSMVGYKNDRYEAFGKVPARLDDVFNLLPSRISAVLMIAAAFVTGGFSARFSGGRAFKIWIRDRYSHSSPNSAQTESVCAGALGIRLGGCSYYGGVAVEKPYIGDDIRIVEKVDIKRANVLMFGTEALCMAVIFTVIKLILIFR